MLRLKRGWMLTIKDEDGTAAAEAAKDLRKMVFYNLQGKYEYIMFVTKPQNP